MFINLQSTILSSSSSSILSSLGVYHIVNDTVVGIVSLWFIKEDKDDEEVEGNVCIGQQSPSDCSFKIVSVVSNSSVEVDSDSSSNDVLSCKNDAIDVGNDREQKFILPNDLYKSLLASAVLGKTVLNRNLNFKENLANFKDNLNALGALRDLKDIKELNVSSVPAFPRNLALHREDNDEKASFAWSEGGEEGGGVGGGGG
ncbi:hypothetical protein PV326_007681, partial [Microctonus aethiopoides]